MSSNSRLTIATHILAWMALVETGRADPVTSERIARSVNTNPVVIRRLLGALARKGLVKSHRGANAGWTLATSADAITLSDIYRAVEDGSLFAMHASPPNQALSGRAGNSACAHTSLRRPRCGAAEAAG